LDHTPPPRKGQSIGADRIEVMAAIPKAIDAIRA